MKIIRTLVLFAFMFSVMSVFTQQTLAAEPLSATQALKIRIDAIINVLKTPEFEGDEKKIDVEINANNTIREEALNFIGSIKDRKMPFNSHIVGAKNVDVIEKIMESMF